MVITRGRCMSQMHAHEARPQDRTRAGPFENCQTGLSRVSPIAPTVSLRRTYLRVAMALAAIFLGAAAATGSPSDDVARVIIPRVAGNTLPARSEGVVAASQSVTAPMSSPLLNPMRKSPAAPPAAPPTEGLSPMAAALQRLKQRPQSTARSPAEAQPGGQPTRGDTRGGDQGVQYIRPIQPSMRPEPSSTQSKEQSKESKSHQSKVSVTKKVVDTIGRWVQRFPISAFWGNSTAEQKNAGNMDHISMGAYVVPPFPCACLCGTPPHSRSSYRALAPPHQYEEWT